MKLNKKLKSKIDNYFDNIESEELYKKLKSYGMNDINKHILNKSYMNNKERNIIKYSIFVIILGIIITIITSLTDIVKDENSTKFNKNNFIKQYTIRNNVAVDSCIIYIKK